MSKTSIPEGPRADTRRILAVHRMYRREFGLLPALVRGVKAGDRERAQIVADHVQLMSSFLHEHHSIEDEFMWPKLLSRGSEEARDVGHLMEDQHLGITNGVEEMETRLQAWRDSAASQQGPALTEALDRLMTTLLDHMKVEEERALPMVETYMTADEWEQMGATVVSRMPPEQLTLTVGMVMNANLNLGDAGDAPAAVPTTINDTALEAYTAYARRIHGTATTPRTSG